MKLGTLIITTALLGWAGFLLGVCILLAAASGGLVLDSSEVSDA